MAHVAIIGAGPCGLYAAITALESGAQVTLIEESDRVGGLAAGHKRGANFYDLGVHMLHAFDEGVYETCADALGSDRLEVPLKAHIKWAGKLYHYPLRGRDILAGIPPFTLARCIVGLGLAELRSRVSTEQGPTAQDALQELYGSPLYEYFFEEFTERYWGIHPREMSAEFVRRKMPRLSAVDVVKNALQKLHLAKPQDSTEGALRFETLHYTSSGSDGLQAALGKKVQELGGKVILNDGLRGFEEAQGHLSAVLTDSGVKIEADCFLSTVPLAHLVKSLTAPESVQDAARSLRYKPMVVFGLLVEKKRCMEALYTYYRDRSFHRVGEPKNAGLKVTPEGHTILIVEKTCEVGDTSWRGDESELDRIKTDLSEEGLCERGDIREVHILKSAHAYPVFSLGFEEKLETVTQFISSYENLISTGRQGAFTYPNMHSAMRMGAEAADELLAKQ